MKDDPKSNIQFVKIVEGYPVLYDVRLEGYSHKDCQDIAWNSVAAAMKDSVANCKEKWRNIRTCLTRHLRQSRGPTKNAGRMRRPYYLAPYLSFLLPFTKTRTCPPWSSRAYHDSGIPADVHPDPLRDDSEQAAMAEEECLKPRILEVKGEATYEMCYPQEVRRACLKEDEAITEEEEDEEEEEEEVIEVGEEDAIEVEEEEEKGVEGRKKVAEAGDEPKRRRIGEDSPKGEALKLASGGLSTIRINHFDAKNARISVDRSPSAVNADMDFFRSLLPELSGMTMSQKSKFRISVLKSLHELLYEA